MTSTGIAIDNTAWVEVADNVDYLLQNKDGNNVYVKASDTEPTSADGSVILPQYGVINQQVLAGRIWVCAKDAQATISISV